jgi:hypothetical protein
MAQAGLDALRECVAPIGLKKWFGLELARMVVDEWLVTNATVN